MRYFAGFNAGISQVIVRSSAKGIDVVSSLLDMGAEGGLSYTLTNTLSLDVAAGGSFGWGFSSVAVTGIIMYGFFGLNYSF